MLGAGSVTAQSRPVCFVEGTSLLTPEGYSAIRNARADLEAAGPRAHLVLRGAADEDASALEHERTSQILLEAIWADLPIGRVKPEPGPQTEDCAVLDLVSDGSIYMAVGHVYGPYFDAGEVTVSPDWARRMRFLVAGYRLGQTRFRVEGYADTSGDAATNMEVSRRRAQNVAAELVRQGVRWDDIVVEWFGETRLARLTPDGVAELVNRRVSVHVTRRPQTDPD